MAKRKPLVFVAGEIVESKATDSFEVGNGTFVTPGSTEDRSIKDRASDIVNVQDFGAKGDGTTDDTDAFQAAAAKAAQDGAVVYVPHGTYKITEPITGEFISFGHPTFTGSGSIDCTDLYNDYVHKTKNVPETITGTKTFAETIKESTAPGSASVAANGTSVPNLNWLKNALKNKDELGALFGDADKLSDYLFDQQPFIDELAKALQGNTGGTPSQTPSQGGSSNPGLDTSKLKETIAKMIADALKGVNTTIPQSVLNDLTDSITKSVLDKLGSSQTDAQKLAAMLGVPVNLTSTMNWYVSTSGSDTPTYQQLITCSNAVFSSAAQRLTAAKLPKGATVNDNAACSYMVAYGWGRKAEYAFKTIQGAIDFVSTYYMLPTSDCTIFVAPGTYDATRTKTVEGVTSIIGGGIIVRSYTTSGGKLILKNSAWPTDPNINGEHTPLSAKVILKVKSGPTGTSAFNVRGAVFDIYGFEFQHLVYGGGGSSSIIPIIRAESNAEVSLHNCRFIITDYTNLDLNNATASSVGLIRYIYAYKNSTVEIAGDSYFEMKRTTQSTEAYKGVIYHAEATSNVAIRTYQNSMTYVGDMHRMFEAERQGIVYAIGSDGPRDFNVSQLKLTSILRLDTGSGFQKNQLNSTTLKGIAPHAGAETLTADDVDTSAGCWTCGYTPNH